MSNFRCQLQLIIFINKTFSLHACCIQYMNHNKENLAITGEVQILQPIGATKGTTKIKMKSKTVEYTNVIASHNHYIQQEQC